MAERCAVCPNATEKPWHLMCLEHWRQVPADLQERLWAEFRRRQGSAEHLAVIGECVEFVRMTRRLLEEAARFGDTTARTVMRRLCGWGLVGDERRGLRSLTADQLHRGRERYGAELAKRETAS